jgi:hypothetical protein
MDIKEILKNASNDILTEDTLNSIQTMFEQTVNTKVEERLGLEKDSIKEAINKDHGNKLKRLLETVDNDHTQKMEEVVKSIFTDSFQKLKKVKTHYESLLKKERRAATAEFKQISEQLSNYLEDYLDEAIPANAIQESAKNAYTQNLLKKIQKISGAESVFSNKKITGIIEQYENKTQQLTEQVNKLKKQKTVFETKTLLESKTAHMPKEMAAFVKSKLSGKSPKFISENIDYVVNMYKRDEQNVTRKEKQQVISEERRSRPTLQVEHQGVDVDNKPTSTNPMMGMYLNGLRSTSGRGR